MHETPQPRLPVDPPQPVVALNLRLPADLHARMRDHADATERTLNGALVWAVREYLARVDPQ